MVRMCVVERPLCQKEIRKETVSDLLVLGFLKLGRL